MRHRLAAFEGYKRIGNTVLGKKKKKHVFKSTNVSTAAPRRHRFALSDLFNLLHVFLIGGAVDDFSCARAADRSSALMHHVEILASAQDLICHLQKRNLPSQAEKKPTVPRHKRV